MSSSITCRRFVARNIDINGEEAVISENYMTNFRQIVPLFAARFSGDFADAEAPGDDSCKHYELARMQSTRPVTVSCMGYCSCLTEPRAIY